MVDPWLSVLYCCTMLNWVYKQMYKLMICIFVFLIHMNIFCQEPVTINLKPINPDSLKYIENIPLWPKHDPPPYVEKSRQSVRTGTFILDDNKYQIGIFNLYSSVYSKASELWIDINQNKQYDFDEDLLEQMLLPFTLQNTSFEVVFVDSCGEYIRLIKSKTPPIAVGLSAPDLEALTLDSLDFQLSKYKGSNIFLFFWTCNPNQHIAAVYEAANYFKEKNIRIICVGPRIDIDSEGFIHDTRVALDGKKIKINWVYVIMKGMSDKNRRLYQVGALMKSFCIDREGIIRSIDQPFTKNEIIEVVENFLN